MISEKNIFDSTAAATLQRSKFNLSHEVKLSGDMGYLYPILCEEVVPGDVFDMGVSAVVRFSPLLAPIMHQVQCKTYSFFVPYRILFDDWEEFITRGATGNVVVTLPIWVPGSSSEVAVGTLWDYLGFPTGVIPHPDNCPLDFPRRAYNLIWNEYFRDQNLQNPRALNDFTVARRNWNKDYFTAALPWQQRGIPPALPIVGTAPVTFNFSPAAVFPNFSPAYFPVYKTDPGDPGWAALEHTPPSTFARQFSSPSLNTAWSSVATVNGSAFSSVDIADLRIAFALQTWMERNARSGVRYTEFLRSHFRVSPTDERLDRPEYIGGTVADVVVSEVLQTSETATTPQGNLAGHGISVQSQKLGVYRVQEYGLIMTLLCVYPRTAYSQGINRSWLRRTTYDFYFPEFSGLSEQEVYNAEIYCPDVSADPTGAIGRDVFGFQGRYDEMRYRPSRIAGLMRTAYAHWHLGRFFSSLPVLNASFVECVPRKDIFAVPTEPGLLVTVANHIDALRPLPAYAEPTGLVR